jgi:hypothetical protein
LERNVPPLGKSRWLPGKLLVFLCLLLLLLLLSLCLLLLFLCLLLLLLLLLLELTPPIWYLTLITPSVCPDLHFASPFLLLFPLFLLRSTIATGCCCGCVIHRPPRGGRTALKHAWFMEGWEVESLAHRCILSLHLLLLVIACCFTQAMRVFELRAVGGSIWQDARSWR